MISKDKQYRTRDGRDVRIYAMMELNHILFTALSKTMRAGSFCVDERRISVNRFKRV